MAGVLDGTESTNGLVRPDQSTRIRFDRSVSNDADWKELYRPAFSKPTDLVDTVDARHYLVIGKYSALTEKEVPGLLEQFASEFQPTACRSVIAQGVGRKGLRGDSEFDSSCEWRHPRFMC